MSREKVAELILDKARSLLGNPLVLLYVYDAKAATFFPWAAMGVVLSRMTEVPLNHVLSLWDGAAERSVTWQRGESIDLPVLLGVPDAFESALLAPLQLEDELLGLICLGRTGKAAGFTAPERALFDVLVGRASDALTGAHFLAQSRAELAEVEVLYQVSQKLGVAQAYEEVVQGIAAFGKLLGMQGLTLSVITRWTEEGVLLASDMYSVPDLRTPEAVQILRDFQADQPTFDVLSSDPRALILCKDAEDPKSPMPEAVRAGLQQLGARGAYLVGLRIKGRWMGFLFFSSLEPLGETNEHFVDLLLHSLAPQVSGALERLWLSGQTETALAETEALYRASSELAAARTYDDVMTVMREYTLMGEADLNISINSFDRPWVGDDMPEWTIPLARWSKLPESAVSARYPLQKFTSARSLLKPDTAILITNVAEDPRLDDNARYLYQKIYSAGSTLFVPLVVAHEWIGYINAIYSQPREFSETAVRRLMNLAAQTAVIIQSIQRLAEADRRMLQLQTAAEVSRTASSMLDLATLLPQVVQLIRERFDLYYVGVFLVDDTRQWAVLRAGTGEAGRKMLEAGHRLAVGGDSMIGMCVARREARIALDVGAEAVRFENPNLPETHSELALPLVARGESIGAMTIQSSKQAAFSGEDITVLQTMADQVANVISNARLFAEAQDSLEDMQDLQRQATVDSWVGYTHKQDVVGYTYDLTELEPLTAPMNVPLAPELLKGEIVAQGGDGGSARLLAPINLHGAPIGLLGFEEPEESRIWSQGDLDLVSAVCAQLSLALENRLLFEQTRDALAETSNLYEIGRHISEAQSIGEVFAGTIEGLRLRPEIDYLVAGTFTPLGMAERLDVAGAWVRDVQEAVSSGESYSLAALGPLYETLSKKGRFVAGDVETAPDFAGSNLNFYRQLGLCGVAAFQLKVREINYGMILIGTQEPHTFLAEELRFYETVIHTAAVALENQQLLQTTQKEAERRAFLNEVMGAASAILEPDELLRSVGQLVSTRLAMPTLILRLYGEHVSPIAVHLEDGTRLESPETEADFKLTELSGVGAAARLRRPITWRFETRPYRSEAFKQLITALDLEESFSVPITVRDEVLGIFVLGRKVGHPEIDEDVMTFLRSAAVNIGVSLENARLYQNAQETAEKLKEVDRLKSEFLANMSHELRTPLNSIIGFSRVILKGIDGPLTDLQQTDLMAIYESGRHLLNLINDILDLSKIEAGKMEFNFETTDLKEVVRGVLSTAVALVKDKSIELRQTMPEGLPTILADERRIRQVILNIVGNAAKFTENGFISVSAVYDDREVVIAIEDTGIGIPADKFGAVFQEFQQVDSSSTRSYGGTGLGLPVSKKFVEAHGGRMWFESELGVGSIFYLALPIQGPPKEAPEEEAKPSAERREVRAIMAVDDDENVIKLFRRYLEKQGYTVIGVTDATQVVDEARQLKPYAITLDILMPNQDGWQVIRDLKSNAETRDIPVIICSILSEANKGMSMGVTDYLVKPISEQELLNALDRLTQDAGPNQVLVVDDHADDRKLLRRILEEAGYIVDEAAGGTEAIVKIHEEPPDLVVLDLMMPEVDGFAVLENLKSSEVTRQIPVVVVTAKELKAEERQALYMRAEALLQKGIFNQEQLLQDIAAALGRLRHELV
jgi:signal transduction histidine kinase/DNA-binding response OmpR family regulator/putative methionine-R-sulfoxide reductase with GAF domain